MKQYLNMGRRKQLAPTTMLRQRALFRMFPRQAIEMLVASLCINTLGLALPLTLLQVYDRIIPYKALASLGWLICGCAVAIILEASLRLARDHLAAWVGSRYEHRLNCVAFERIMTTPLEEIESQNTMDLMDRLQASSRLRSAYCNQFFQLFFDFPFALIYLFTIWMLDPNAGKFLCAIAGLILVTTVYAKYHYEIATHEKHENVNVAMGFLVEILGKIHLIKALSLEELILRRYEHKEIEESRTNLKMKNISSVPNNVGTVFSDVTLFGVIAVGASSVISGEITLGVLTASMIMSSRAIDPLQRLASFWLRSSETRRGRQKLQTVLELPIQADRTERLPKEMDWSVYLEDIEFSFPGQPEPLFSGLNLGLPSGKLLGITASNSRGRSTLLHLIAGTMTPTSGQVWIGDYDLATIDRRDLQGRIAYVAESAILFKGTVLDNLSLFDPANQSRALKLARQLGLDSQIAQLPKGYQTELTRESNNALPRSLIQFIAMARALVTDPNILLLDQADAGLDTAALERFAETLEQRKGGETVVLVTDNLTLLRKVDKIFRVLEGKIVDVNMEELIEEQKKTSILKGVA